MRNTNTLPAQLQEGLTAAQILEDGIKVRQSTMETAKVKGGWRAWLKMPDGSILRTTEVHPTEEIAKEHCV